MITFSTVFPLNRDATVGKIAELAKQWLAGSPHTNLDKLLPASVAEQDDWEFGDADENVKAHKVILEELVLFGLRYVKNESSGMRWVTEFQFASSPEGNLVAVTVHVDSELTALSLPPARKPYIVRQLVQEFGGGKDGDLYVTEQPYYLKASEIEFASAIITGDCGNALPIVYLSAFAQDRKSVDPVRLAHWLSGIAHVVVEPDREFSFRLAIEVNHRNTYGGAVGIYWPDRDAHSLILPRDYDFDPKAIAGEVSKIIRDRAVRLRIPRNLTWANLQETRAKIQLARLRQEGSHNLEEYIKNFDQELQAKEQSLKDAEAEIRRLESEVHGLRSRSKPVQGSPVLVRGTESDLYEDECLCFIIDALRIAADNAPGNSRRHHVLASIIAANPVQDYASDYAEAIKRLLSNYRSLESPMSHELEEMGFEISSDGKHHKLKFRGDGRYQVSMPKTSSDHRAGKNLVSEINRLLF